MIDGKTRRAANAAWVMYCSELHELAATQAAHKKQSKKTDAARKKYLEAAAAQNAAEQQK